jgi:hypothetical protein
MKWSHREIVVQVKQQQPEPLVTMISLPPSDPLTACEEKWGLQRQRAGLSILRLASGPLEHLEGLQEAQQSSFRPI